MARPAHVPTPQTRRFISLAAGLGGTNEGLAHIIGVSIGTLRKHYAKELKHGTEDVVRNVASRLYKQAMSKVDSQPNTTARLFLLKTRGKFREIWPAEANDPGEQRPIVNIVLPDNGRGFIPPGRTPRLIQGN